MRGEIVVLTGDHETMSAEPVTGLDDQPVDFARGGVLALITRVSATMRLLPARSSPSTR